MLQSPEYFRLLVDLLTYRYMTQDIDVVAGLDARGFIIGAALAYQLNVGFVPIRKKGKLPFTTVSESYALEYGEATVEIHTDAIKDNARVLLVDDLVATGGTMHAGIKLIRKLGGNVVEAAAILEFTDLPGGDQVQMLGTLRFLASAIDPATILLPGHGAVTTMEHEHHGNPYLAEAKIRGGDLKA